MRVFRVLFENPKSTDFCSSSYIVQVGKYYVEYNRRSIDLLAINKWKYRADSNKVKFGKIFRMKKEKNRSYAYRHEAVIYN